MQRKAFSNRIVENSDEIDRYLREKEVYTKIVKQNIGYWQLGEWLDSNCNKDEDGWQEADEIAAAIVRQIVSNKPYEMIHGQKYPREIIKSAMLKLNIYHVENVIQQMREVLNIRNYEAYLN